MYTDIRSSASVSKQIPRNLSFSCSAQETIARTTPRDISRAPPFTSRNARTNFSACSLSTVFLGSLESEL